MIYKNFGVDGEKISVLGLGTNGLGDLQNHDDAGVENRIRIYRSALERGVNYFSTAQLYGEGFAQEVLGKALGRRRNKITIASKFNPDSGSVKEFKKSLEESLRRLKSDYIDIYQMHWPNASVSLELVCGALAGFVKQGKVRYIGVSNFNHNLLEKVSMIVKDKSFAVVENEYNVWERSAEKEILNYCGKKGLILAAYSPLNRGKIVWNKKQFKVLQALSKKYRKTPAQIILNWLVSRTPVVALVRTDKISHLIENTDSFDFKLEAGDIRLINRTFVGRMRWVSLDKIELEGGGYRTEEEAIANRLNLLPSPQTLADNLKVYDMFKPLRLVPFKGKYRFDNYDYWGELKKYWAWRILWGVSRPVPAYIT